MSTHRLVVLSVPSKPMCFTASQLFSSFLSFHLLVLCNFFFLSFSTYLSSFFLTIFHFLSYFFSSPLTYEQSRTLSEEKKILSIKSYYCESCLISQSEQLDEVSSQDLEVATAKYQVETVEERRKIVIFLIWLTFILGNILFVTQ